MAQATNLLVATPTVVSALKCDTTTGPTGSVTVKLTAASATSTNIITVGTSGTPTGLTVTAPATLTLNSSTASVTYTITTTAGCAGLSLGANTIPVQFTSKVNSGSAASDVSYSASDTVTNTVSTSPLTASPSSVTLNCTNANGTYTNGPAQNFSVTSSATGGNTPVTVSNVPAWLSISLVSGSNLASSTAVQFSASINGSCSGTVGSSKTATVQLQNLPATPYQTITVTLVVVGPSQLTLSNYGTSSAPMTLNYTKYQTSLTQQSVTVYGPTVYFNVDTTTLPSWLTVNFTSGEATPNLGGLGGFPLTFTVTKVADSLTPGTQTATISLKVAGYAPTALYVKLVVGNTAPTLSVVEGTVRNLAWSVGQPLPSATITAVSSGAPIPFTTSISAGSPDAGATVTPSAGLAYTFGTAIAVTFSPLDFAGAQPGVTLYSAVNIGWTGMTIPVSFSISIEAPSTTAVLTGISPSNLPTATAGEAFTVTLYGSGFVASTDPTQKTTVGVVSGGHLVADANISANVVSASTIILIITVPAGTTDPLSFSTPGTIVTLGVCNPNGSSCSTATGTQPLTIDAGPTIQPNGVTSASTFTAVVPPNGTLAPYDIISLFGSNFCTSSGSGCTASQVLYPTISAAGVYGTTVSPDGGQRNLQVMFYPHASTTGGWAAPLLFATNNQINAIVPGEIVTSSQYDIIVKFGTLSSPAYTFTAAATDPGIFVVNTNNNGAIVLPSGLVTNNSSNAGNLRVSQTNSDSVSIFMTGLGTPNSTGSNATSTGTYIPFTDCIAATGAGSYQSAAGLTTLDGAAINYSLITPGMEGPCFNPASYLTVTVGGQPATVEWAGWAPNSIAGLYQVNILLPAYGAGLTSMDATPVTVGLTSGALQVAVVVTVGSKNSQAGVGMWVQPAQTLLAQATPVSGVYPFTVSALSGAAGTPVALDQVIATGGTSPVYTVTGATGSDSGGAAVVGNFAVNSSGNVTITRAFLAGTYSVTITSTDGGTPALPATSITLTFTVS